MHLNIQQPCAGLVGESLSVCVHQLMRWVIHVSSVTCEAKQYLQTQPVSSGQLLGTTEMVCQLGVPVGLSECLSHLVTVFPLGLDAGGLEFVCSSIECATRLHRFASRHIVPQRESVTTDHIASHWTRGSFPFETCVHAWIVSSCIKAL